MRFSVSTGVQGNLGHGVSSLLSYLVPGSDTDFTDWLVHAQTDVCWVSSASSPNLPTQTHSYLVLGPQEAGLHQMHQQAPCSRTSTWVWPIVYYWQERKQERSSYSSGPFLWSHQGLATSLNQRPHHLSDVSGYQVPSLGSDNHSSPSTAGLTPRPLDLRLLCSLWTTSLVSPKPACTP